MSNGNVEAKHRSLMNTQLTNLLMTISTSLLLASADALPDALYIEGDGRFEFDRTISRLLEMQSEEYLAEGHGPH